MIDFSNRFPDEKLVRVLGDTIIYSASGFRGTLKAFMNFNVERVGSDGYTINLSTEVEIIKKQLSLRPARGHQLAHNGTTYTVDAIVSENDIYITLALKK